MVIATNTDRGNGVRAAYNLQRSVASHDFGIPTQVTMSIGVASVMKGDTIETLVKATDTALYRAEEEGRIRVVY